MPKSIANPHFDEPVESGLYCFRINDSRSWDASLFVSESDAIDAAQKYCNRTKTRFHIVCDAPFSNGRFERLLNTPLCTKNPELNDIGNEEPIPCTACIDRLVVILSNQK